jgi:hypothetical protein
MYRIVHWGTGNVGALALAAMLDRADYEIVGHYVFNKEKLGRDSGELVGRPPIGVAATDDIDALIALKPDVLTWFGNAMFDPLASARTMARFLEAGISVVTTGLYEAGAADSTPEPFRALLETACAAGKSAIYSTGFDPGFATSQLAVTCYGIAHRIDQVRLQEFADYGQYPDEPTLRQIMGFGGPLDGQTALSDGAMARRVWTATVEDNLRALGLQADALRFVYHTAPALKDRDTSIGRIDKGSVSVFWFQLIGVVAGQGKVVLEHVNWMHPDDIPGDWPKPPLYRGAPAAVGYRIRVEGSPSFDVEVEVETTKDGMLCTALHATNAIPRVVAAPPGILGQREILPYGPGPMRTT